MPRRACSLILALVLALGAWPAAPARAGVTLEEERKIGREAYDEVMAQMPMVDDPDCVEYVRNLGRRLVGQLKDNPFSYTFNIADSPEMNAFALPGGYVFMFRGMMTNLDSEAELAGILGHEISHVSYRHLANRMDKTAPLNMAMMAGMLAGILLGAAGGAPQLGQALAVGSMAGGVQQYLAFSREDEEQADYGGFKLMTSLGYPGQAMAVSFNRIWQQERMLGADVPTYLRSHPNSPQRMERMNDLVRTVKSPPRPQDDSEFLRIKTRLIALYESEQTALTTFARLVKERPGDPLPIYGLALLETRRSRFDQAQEYLEVLKKRWPGSIHVKRLQAKVHLRRGEFAPARDLLESVIVSHPEDREALHSLGQTYLHLDQAAQACRIYERLLSLDPLDDQARYDLGVAYGKRGQEARASLHLGLAFLQRRNDRAARFHLNRAVT
ncbi:MAG: M48 family metalloprotease, partial [Desulfarculus sp.]|nr:M48 family metalloprotease [Desulfarculus sp.]